MELNVQMGLSKEEYIKLLEITILTQESIIKKQENIIKTQLWEVVSEMKENIEVLLKDCTCPYDMDPCKGCTKDNCNDCFEGGASENK